MGLGANGVEVLFNFIFFSLFYLMGSAAPVNLPP